MEPARPGLFWRALAAFLLLPGMVAFAVPLLWLTPQAPHHFDWLGLLPLTIGAVLLLWTVRDFYVVGRGTLAPWSPPRELVVIGLYRFSRNPMYVAVVLVLIGWAVAFHSNVLGIYALAIAIAFHHASCLAKSRGLRLRMARNGLGTRAKCHAGSGVGGWPVRDG